MKTLLKKEFRELFCNYRGWSLIVVIVGVLYLFEKKSVELGKPFYSWFILMVANEYIFESFVADTKMKGIVFVYNVKASYLDIFISKILASILMLAIEVVAIIPIINDIFSVIDIFWLVPMIVFTSALMHLGAILGKGSEATTTFLTMGITFILLLCLLLLNNIFLISLISICLALLAFFAAWKLSESNHYRTQI